MTDGRQRVGVALASAVLVAAFVGGASAQSGKQQSPRAADAKNVAIADPATKFVPGELLVRFRGGVSAASRVDALADQGATLVSETAVPGLVLARLKPGQGVPGAVQAFERRSDVLYAQPNWIYRASATPNDPRYANGELWGLHNTGQNGGITDADIDAPEAWDTTTGSSGVVVAVVDTGIAYDHPDLAPNIWANPGEVAGDGVDNDGNGRVDDHRGWDFISGDNDPRDTNAHGTHVAGTIGARGNNATGVVGVNWNVRLMPVRVLGTDGSGTTFTVMSGFAYAAQEGAKVVNASLGGGGYDQATKDVIDAATTTLFVVAAGNGGADGVGDNNEATPQYPCNYTSSNLVCVAATTRTDGIAGFSNFGTTSVDLGAPGTQIMSTWLAFQSKFTDGFETAAGWASEGSPTTWARTTESSHLRIVERDRLAGRQLRKLREQLVPRAGPDLAGGIHRLQRPVRDEAEHGGELRLLLRRCVDERLVVDRGRRVDGNDDELPQLVVPVRGGPVAVRRTAVAPPVRALQ